MTENDEEYLSLLEMAKCTGVSDFLNKSKYLEIHLDNCLLLLYLV